ncbi:hypothetical protein NBRC116589_13290 [Ruegeria sp. HU-ET01832]|uniref:hypothetical protein n=1 Tax=Ruegeria sp. HU-ET01832 TaxID=3135906 RepID=UPI00310B7AC9
MNLPLKSDHFKGEQHLLLPSDFHGSNSELYALLKRLNNALVTTATLAAADPVYLPIFERIEIEIKQLEGRIKANPLDRAKRIAQATAML